MKQIKSEHSILGISIVLFFIALTPGIVHGIIYGGQQPKNEAVGTIFACIIMGAVTLAIIYAMLANFIALKRIKKKPNH